MEFVSMGWKKQMGNISSGFQPSDIPNQKLWNRFNSGIIETGAGVSQWDDVSGNGNHLLQGTDLDRPQKQADGSIITDGIRQFLKAPTFTWDQPETVFILFKQKTWTSLDYIYDGDLSAYMTLIQHTSTPSLAAYAASFSSDDGNLALDTYGIATTVFNGAASSFQIDDNTKITGDFGARDSNGFTLGANGGATQFGHAQVKEVIGYAGVLDAAQIAQVKRYLQSI